MNFTVVNPIPKSEKSLAGVGGFEPPNAGSKDPWLTACRHPNVLDVDNLSKSNRHGDRERGRHGDFFVSKVFSYSPRPRVSASFLLKAPG